MYYLGVCERMSMSEWVQGKGVLTSAWIISRLQSEYDVTVTLFSTLLHTSRVIQHRIFSQAGGLTFSTPWDIIFDFWWETWVTANLAEDLRSWNADVGRHHSAESV